MRTENISQLIKNSEKDVNKMTANITITLMEERERAIAEGRIEGRIEGKTEAQGQKCGRGSGNQGSKRGSHGTKSYDGRRGSQISAEVQYGQRNESG